MADAAKVDTTSVAATPHTKVTASASPEEGPLFTRCHRWRTHLSCQSKAYRELELERERGWKSPALDAWYHGRRGAGAKEATAGPNKDSDSRGATIVGKNPDGVALEASASAAVAPTTTSFADADIAQLAERYRVHCRRVLPAAAPGFFAPHTPATATTPPPTFMDMGCAPGGVSKYLTQDLRWSGIGITLPTSAGGIAVDAELLRPRATGEPSFVLWEGDITSAPNRWQPAALSSPPTADGWDDKRRFTFVNGGAVQDHGQRIVHEQQQRPQPPSAEPHGRDGEIRKAVRETCEEQEVEAAGPPSTPAAILPWLTLFLPQLRVALQYVEEGGSIMLVYGAPQCASFMILLRALGPLLTPLCPSSGEADCPQRCGGVSVLETMHLVKPPVYVLLHRVYARGREPHIARVLAALDPTSSVLSPVETDSATSEAESAALTSMTAAERLEAKQLFWLGETDAGFALAQEGFRQCGHLVEGVWERTRRFLEGRRLRAERDMSARQTGRQLGQSAVSDHAGRRYGDNGSAKRPRQ